MFVADEARGCDIKPTFPAERHSLEMVYARFIETDPLGYEDGLNWYNYVGGDPINKVDPSGLKTVWTCVDAGGGLVCGWSNDGQGDVRDLVINGVTIPGAADDLPAGQDVLVIAPTQKAAAKAQASKKPAYCLSVGYKSGEALNTVGHVLQQAGVITSIFGIPEAGAVFYGVGTAARFGSDLLKSVGGAPPLTPLPGAAGYAVSAAAHLSPLPDYVSGAIVDHLGGQIYKDPC